MTKTELYKIADTIISKKFPNADSYPLRYMYWQGYKRCQKDSATQQWSFPLNKFEMFYLLQGCANGSHLRQGIWKRYVEEVLPNISTDYVDCLWWWCRRDLYWMYEGKHIGWLDFIHFLAAFHRGNYALVKYKTDKKSGIVMCYRFDHRWYLYGKFSMFIAEDDIVKVDRLPYVDNEAVEFSKVDWWKNLDIYENCNQ